MSEEKEEFHLVHEEPTVKKDWEISDLYHRAWQLVWHNKVIWVFAAAAASLSYSSNSSSSSHSSSSSSSPAPSGNPFESILNSVPKDSDSAHTMTKVLGEATNPLQQTWTSIQHTIPLSFLFILGGELLLLIIIGLVIRFVYQAWAEASLIHSTHIASLGRKPSIAESGSAGFKYIKSFIAFSLYPLLAFLIIIAITAVIAVLAFSLGNLVIKIAAVILLIIEVVFLIYASIMLAITLIFATRQVVISEKSTGQSLTDSYKIAKKKSGASLILGFVNTLVAGIINFIPTFFILAIVVGNILNYVFNHSITVWLIAPSVALVLLLLVVSTVVTAITTGFKATVWTLAYHQIKGKYDSH